MVTLGEYRKALGTRADGLLDVELQKRLEYTERFAEAFYEWWHKRKDYSSCPLSGKYSLDIATDAERYEQEVAVVRPEKLNVLAHSTEWVAVQYLVKLDDNFVRGAREIWKMKKQNHLQS